MQQEEWKPIKGYEGLYEVSSFGHVRSVDRVRIFKNGRKRFFPGKIIKPYPCTNTGYLMVGLKGGVKPVCASVHRLVAAAFLGVSELQVNHIDGDKQNNHVENLEYTTQSENMLHAYRLGLEKGHAGYGKCKKVRCIETGKIYESAVQAAKEHNAYRSQVSVSIFKKVACKGFHFEYVK